MGARERILAATASLMENEGFEAVNVAAAAAAAQVSRQTVYTHFRSRDDLITQTISQVRTGLTDRIIDAIRGLHEPDEFVIELLVMVRREFRQAPLLGNLLFREGNPVLIDNLSDIVKPTAAEFLAPLLERAPELKDRFDDVVEVMLRIGFSLLQFDTAAVHEDDDLRGFLRRTLVPALGL